ncbi:putative emp24/gp25L/p24 family/GOLD [Monocercomonoides exilis]|uniref:putative emp24/gp25L/p24 family/GOLD n=1 Tax=Monocercomonoides exilis TaxID=2049356 RepID=UPI0035596505|nr:putative emp24/gp25L/p24 family/GOLD [Monocercomonoides exilis]
MIVYLLISFASAILIEVDPDVARCISHEFDANELVIIEYSLYEEQRTTMDISLMSPKGDLLNLDENFQKGHFTFTTQSNGDYEMCVAHSNIAKNKINEPVLVEVNIIHGPEVNLFDDSKVDAIIQTLEGKINFMDKKTKDINVQMLKTREKEEFVIHSASMLLF